MHALYEAAIPKAQRDDRKALLREFAATGFPDKGLESWHYTDFSALAELGFSSSRSPVAAAEFPFDSAQALPLATPDPLSFSTSFALDGLNAALAQQGVNKMWEGVSHRPLLIAEAEPGDGAMAHRRHQFSLLEGAQATLVIWDEPGAAATSASFATSVLQLTLTANSQLTLIRLQQAPASATRALHVQANLSAGASLRVFSLDLSAAKSRFELEVDLKGAGASVEAHGLVAVTDKAHADAQLRIIHSAPHCRSLVDYRLLAAGRAKVVFNGGVLVREGAIKTDSQTHCHSLLLSAKAEIDAKPELEINADDVQCAHGATYGQLNDDAAFYLQSRGISKAQAQTLLTRAFATKVLESLPLEGVRAEAERVLAELLEPSA